MKKFWEKHSLGKILVILAIIALVSTWFIPRGSFGSDFSKFTKIDDFRLGLFDIGGIFYQVTAFCMDKMIFLIVLGAFYEILSKLKAYRVLIGKIANKMKGKEILFACITSFVLALFATFSTSTFAVLVFVPFVISILSEMKFDKVTALSITFGSILVGGIGSIFGGDALFILKRIFSLYTGKDLIATGWITRLIVFVGAFGLFTLFNVLHMKKVLKDKKAEKINDVFEIEETKDKTKIWPTVTILCIIALFVLLGFIPWEECFGIEIFTKFHEWLIGLSISDFPVISNFLGTQAVAFSHFSLFSLVALLIIFGIILLIMGRIKANEAIDGVIAGGKKMLKPVLAVCAVYFIFTITTILFMSNASTSVLMKVDGKPNINIDYKGSGNAYFNVDTDNDGKADYNLVGSGKDCKFNCDTNNDGWPDKNLDFDGNGKIDENDKAIVELFSGESILNLDSDNDGTVDVNVDTDISLPGTILNSFLIGALQSDTPLYTEGYYDYLYTSYYVKNFGASLELIFLITVTMFAFAALFVPTSGILAVGLCYTDVEYKDWLKYVWKFVVSVFVFLLAIYIFQYLI